MQLYIIKKYAVHTDKYEEVASMHANTEEGALDKYIMGRPTLAGSYKVQQYSPDEVTFSVHTPKAVVIERVR